MTLERDGAGSSRAATTLPIGFDPTADETLRRAYGHYREHLEAASARVVDKLPILEDYDVAGMTRVAAICHCGRSGSLLLASFLDGHDDIVMTARLTSSYLYEFWRDYASLSLWEQLIVYPTYAGLRDRIHGGCFAPGDLDDDSMIAAADYYSSVHALFGVYGGQRVDPVDRRRRFFQLFHVAYAVAVGRRSRNRRPLIVYSQHSPSEELARSLVEDFPRAQFIHTVRDPISTFDSWLEWHFNLQFGRNRAPPSEYRFPAFDAVRQLLAWDRAQSAMEPRTRAVRFEDLHLRTADTLRRVADWLRIPYRPSMLQSTFNGKPYVVRGGGVAWSGPRPENSGRRARNLHALDRLMIFALLHHDFVAWNYPSPKILRHVWIRACGMAACWVVPMKMELANARIIIVSLALPDLRHGRVLAALSAPLRLLKCRMLLMRLIAEEALRRMPGQREPLRLL